MAKNKALHSILLVVITVVAWTGISFLHWSRQLEPRSKQQISIFYPRQEAATASDLPFGYTKEEGLLVYGYAPDSVELTDRQDMRESLGFGDVSDLDRLILYYPGLTETGNSFAIVNQDSEERMLLSTRRSGWPLSHMYGVSLQTLWDQFDAGRPSFRAYVENAWFSRAAKSSWPIGMADVAFSIKMSEKVVQIYEEERGWRDYSLSEMAEVHANTIMVTPTWYYTENGVMQQPAQGTNNNTVITSSYGATYFNEATLFERARTYRESGTWKTYERIRGQLEIR